MSHIPVLLEEVCEGLALKPGVRIIDATANGGGHAAAILERILPGGKLIAIEWDKSLARALGAKFTAESGRGEIVIINRNYADIEEIATSENIGHVQGVVFDLGMSSWHIESAGRGFSFERDEPLDMRYYAVTDENQNSITAAEIVNTYSLDELADIFLKYGEETFGGRIAAAIVSARKAKPIMNTFDLVNTIRTAVPFWYRHRRIHFATKTFQALRIAVNNEFGNMERGLSGAVSLLDKGGRLAVITFHSLEDRIVKHFLQEQRKAGSVAIITKKPLRANLVEVTQNRRSRSAKLRIAEKI